MLKRKQKLFLLIGSSGLVFTGVTTTLIAQTQTTTEPFKFRIDTEATPNFQAEKVDQTNSKTSATDYNLPKAKQEEKIVAPPVEETPPQTIFNPIIKDPEKEKEKEQEVLPPSASDPIEDAPKKDVEIPPTVVPEPEPEKPIRETRKIKIEDIEFEADIQTIPKRQYEQSDVEKGITNRIPYYAEITFDVINVKNALTAENIAKSTGAAQSKATKIGAYTTPYISSLQDDRDIEAKQAQIAKDGNVSEHFGNLWFRYHMLLTSKENVKQYLLDSVTDEQLDKWWNMKETLTWPRSIGTETRELGKMLILMHIDPKKITKLSQTEKDSLANGYIIPEYGGDVYVNANGEWTSSTHEPVVNTVQAEYKRNNQVYRVMGNNTWYWRSSEDVLLGKYHNWNKRDITEQFKSEGLDIPDRGISINEYTRIEKVEGSDREKTVVVTIDVVQPDAYKKAEKLIADLQAKGKEITGYRIMNIGKSGADQNMDKIFAALPKKLPLLELFFESKNTSALKYLKDKEIDELSLLSNNRLNVNADDWSINPWALNKVAWVNMADYNTTFSTDPNQPPFYSRITFDNLAFDAEDYKTLGDWTIINNGLRMAYWTRNNERIFQGAWGPGLKPDRSSDGNSYPMGVDFSRIPTIKTLRGMEFHDITNKQKSTRKLNKIKLFNDGAVWEVNTTDLNEAQFDDILAKPVVPMEPRPKITFSNGKNTKSIRIRPTQNVQNLNSDGLRHLATLIEYSDGTFNRQTQIIVTDGAVALYNTLKNAGYNVRYTSTEDEFEIV